MAFRKVRETFAAFQAPQKIPPTTHERIKQHEQILRDRVNGKEQEEAVNFIVLIAIVIPVSIGIGSVLSDALSVSHATASTVLGALFAYLFADLHSHIIRWIPFHKLNPYFGSKIQETIQAFKNPA